MKTIEAKHPLRYDFANRLWRFKSVETGVGTNLDFLWWLSFVGDEGPLEPMVGWYRKAHPPSGDKVGSTV